MHIHKSSKLHQQLKVIFYLILVLSLLTFFYFNYNVLSCAPIVQSPLPSSTTLCVLFIISPTVASDYQSPNSLIESQQGKIERENADE